MPSLLLVVFVVQLLIHLANTVGAAAINDLLWTLYNKLPTSTSSDYARLRSLRKDVVRLKAELNSTSAQDQFAKWAKLDRQYNKTLAEHDKTAQSLSARRAQFATTFSAIRWLSTNGVLWGLQFYHGKTPMFWLHKGWVPWWVEWLLSFPRAPLGSVSIQVWAIACGRVVRLVGEGVVAVYGLVLVGREKRGEGQREKVAMPAGGGGGGGGEKREL